jgi:hypothetical protein
MERMKKIFPIVVNPVKRWGVPARRRLMPAVDRGTVNQAQVKLLALVLAGELLVGSRRCLVLLLEPSFEGDVSFRAHFGGLCHGVSETKASG